MFVSLLCHSHRHRQIQWIFCLKVTCFLFIQVVSQVKMNADIDPVSRALASIDGANPSRSFESVDELQTFIVNLIDHTFSAGCAAYKQYITGSFTHVYESSPTNSFQFVIQETCGSIRPSMLLFYILCTILTSLICHSLFFFSFS